MQDPAPGAVSQDDATALAAAHREGRRDPRATVVAALARARALQSSFNALALLDETGALQAAAHPAARSGALAGVPVTVKDILDVAGLPTRWGSPLFGQAPPAKADAIAVGRLREAGAIILGKSTTSEFAATPLGHAPLTGLTRNPWAPDRTCGGSSAGAGVAVATEIASVALATDAGCSTRLPAACTGVFGLKPTLGRVPHGGVPEGFANFIHIGLLSRTVRDLALALSVAAGAHPADPHSLGHPPFTSSGAAGLAGARVLLWLKAGNSRVDEEVVAATRRAAETLEQLGARVEEVPYALENPDPAWRVLQQVNWAARFAALPGEARAALTPALAEGIGAGLACSGLDLQRALVRRTALFRGVQAVFGGGVDFVLTPCTSAPPVPAEQDPAAPLVIEGEAVGDLRTEWLPYLSLFDLTGHPALAMPAGFAACGAPLGVQLVAAWGGEARLLAAAVEYEAAAPPPHWHAA